TARRTWKIIHGCLISHAVNLGIADGSSVRTVDADGIGPGDGDVRFVERPQPSLAAGIRNFGRFRKSPASSFAGGSVGQTRRKPMLPFPRIGAPFWTVSIPAPFNDRRFLRKDSDQAKGEQTFKAHLPEPGVSGSRIRLPYQLRNHDTAGRCLR